MDTITLSAAKINRFPWETIELPISGIELLGMNNGDTGEIVVDGQHYIIDERAYLAIEAGFPGD